MQRFLGIDLTQGAPDYTAIWRFRERLGTARMKALFEELGAFIDIAGFEARKGQMLDASRVQKPKTRKPVEPRDGEPALPRQQAVHRDGEANWTQKGRSYFGYKNNLNADVEFGFIRDYAVTTAAAHDSQALPELLDIPVRPAAVRRLGLSLGGHGAPLQGSPPDPPRDAQGTAQSAADGDAKAHESSLGQDACKSRTRVRAHRPVPQRSAAALYGAGARRGGDRVDQLRGQAAVTGDDASAGVDTGLRIEDPPRERASGAVESEDQHAAKGNRRGHFSGALIHGTHQATVGKFKSGSSNCAVEGCRCRGTNRKLR